MSSNTNRSKCAICGRPINRPNRSWLAYCLDHKAYAELDDKVLDDMPFELMLDLIMGVFQRAREDYMYDIDGKRSDAEVFFRSEWAQLLSLSRFDPEDVLKQMEEERMYGFIPVRDDPDGSE